VNPVVRLAWPDGLDEASFLARYWQRVPLLLRQAVPDFETPLPPDELAGLALEPDTTPRLIRKAPDGRYALEHGPFDADVFETLGTRDWSLLVTDVEKHLPELVDWLQPFRLAPDWRLDDLMVSFAPDGASVGAHMDEYDVFLLQASGTRRWSIDARAGVEYRSVVDGDLRLVANFHATDTWDLAPGDLLYLPPGVPHHGVAVGDDCTTWSIGFRAPSAADVVAHFAQRLAERLAGALPQARLSDAGVGRGAPGEIDAATVDAVERVWRAATDLDRDTLVELTGELLTLSGTGMTPDDEWGADDSTADGTADIVDLDALAVAPFARLARVGRGDSVTLFANGESFRCSRALAERLFARSVEPPDAFGDDEATGDGGEPTSGRRADGLVDDGAVLDALLDRGVLVRR